MAASKGDGFKFSGMNLKAFFCAHYVISREII
jgi:hypothetical protein